MGKRLHLLLFALLLGGCAAPFQRTELYFGANRPGGAPPVSKEEWDAFVRKEIAPRFSGYTVVDATGGWQAADGTVQREKTRLVILLHAPADRRAVETVARRYREAFRQESVLIVTQPARAAF